MLRDVLNLNNPSVISIVGAGGKTSFMFNLAEELRSSNKVLVSTTTKIYKPDETSYDFICMDSNKFSIYDAYKKNGVYIYGKTLTPENKLIGLEPEFFEEKQKYFQHVLLEADGSKRKPLKGWNDTEPVICKNTTKTIGILDITSLGLIINEDNIHRLNLFLDLTNSEQNKTVDISTLISLIINPNGLFKNALGEKVLFINKVESNETKFNSIALLKDLLIKANGYVDKIIIGSLKEKKYHLVFTNINESLKNG